MLHRPRQLLHGTQPRCKGMEGDIGMVGVSLDKAQRHKERIGLYSSLDRGTNIHRFPGGLQ